MSSVKDKVADVAEHGPVIAHLIRMVQHYGKVNAKLHAGAITFFGFLSLFPLLALLVFVVGMVSLVYPGADQQIRNGVENAFPGIIGGPTGVSLDDVRTFSGWAAVVGLGGVLFTGLGFIQVLRLALMYVFERPIAQESFVVAKIKDLVGLVTVGGTLLLSILLGSVLTRFSTAILGLLGVADDLAWLLTLLSLAVGFLANLLLFFVMFRQLSRPEAPNKALLGGALLGAIGFEVLKQLSTTLVGLTEGNAAFQAFGIALIVVVLLNYFARLTLYAASWAHTSPAAMAARTDRTPFVQGPQLPDLTSEHVREPRPGRAARWGGPFAAGGAAMLALVALVRRRDDA